MPRTSAATSVAAAAGLASSGLEGGGLAQHVMGELGAILGMRVIQ